MSLAQLFPYSVWECWWLAPAALIFDLWLGDPDLPWRHPVCAVGKLLEKLEAPARNFMRAGGPEAERLRGRFAGGVALAVLVGCTGLVVWGLVCLPVLGGLLALYLAAVRAGTVALDASAVVLIVVVGCFCVYTAASLGRLMKNKPEEKAAKKKKKAKKE